MTATRIWAGSLAGMLLLVSSASAQYVSPVTGRPLGYAPDACGPGFYVLCPDGTTLGPNYYLRPCFQPFQGVTPRVIPIQRNGNWEFQTQPQAPQPQADAYPYHPFVRGPRDFFMFRENMEEMARGMRPSLVP